MYFNVKKLLFARGNLFMIFYEFIYVECNDVDSVIMKLRK